MHVPIHPSGHDIKSQPVLKSVTNKGPQTCARARLSHHTHSLTLCISHTRTLRENLHSCTARFACVIAATKAALMSLFPIQWPLPDPRKYKKRPDEEEWPPYIRMPSPPLKGCDESGDRLVRMRCTCCGRVAEHCRRSPRHFSDTTSRALHKLPEIRSPTTPHTMEHSLRSTSTSSLSSPASGSRESYHRELRSRRGKALMISGGMPLNPKAAMSLRSLQEKQLRSWSVSDLRLPPELRAS